MKIRSKALYNYLQQTGVLNSTPEAIAFAKKQYRTLYKKQWKQKTRPKKEIRIEVTIKQYGIIKLQAHEYNLRPTTYARNVILSAIEAKHFVAERDTLLQVAQILGMAVIAMRTNNRSMLNIVELLEQAETILMQYLTTTL